MMKVLLTGASGFVGSQILDRLCARKIPVDVLLRSSSPRRLIEHHLSGIEIRLGTIADPTALDRAMEGVTHVIHCAGCTKAVRVEDYYDVNQLGTRNVVTAVNHHAATVERLLHLSSLETVGPVGPERPAKDSDEPQPA